MSERPSFFAKSMPFARANVSLQGDISSATDDARCLGGPFEHTATQCLEVVIAFGIDAGYLPHAAAGTHVFDR